MLKISSPRTGSGSAADAVPVTSARTAPRTADAAPRTPSSLARALLEVLVAAAAALLAQRAESGERRLGVATLRGVGQLLRQVVDLLRRRLELVRLLPDGRQGVSRRLVAALREHVRDRQGDGGDRLGLGDHEVDRLRILGQDGLDGTHVGAV